MRRLRKLLDQPESTAFTVIYDSCDLFMRATENFVKKLLDQPESTTFTSFNICCNVSERVAEKLFHKLPDQPESTTFTSFNVCCDVNEGGSKTSYFQCLIMKEKPEPVRNNCQRKNLHQ